MPKQSHDLHGNAPDHCSVALLLIDVINGLEFPTGAALYPHALRAARQLSQLKQRAQRAGVPCVYVNDNYGRWRSDFRMQVDHCLGDDTPGKPIVELLLPSPQDYFVLKPKHSAFYQTCLSLLLEHLGVETLVIGGFTTDSCVMFSATDAHLRGFRLLLLSDGTASDSSKNHRAALVHMARTLHAQTPKCAELGFVRRKGDANVRLHRAHHSPA